MKYYLVILTFIFSTNVLADIDFSRKPCPKPKPTPVVIKEPEMRYTAEEHFLLSATISSLVYSELKVYNKNKYRAYFMSVIGTVALNSALEQDKRNKKDAVMASLGGAVFGPVLVFDF